MRQTKFVGARTNDQGEDWTAAVVPSNRGSRREPARISARDILLLSLLLLLLLPATGLAQFTFTTNNGALTITGYTGPGGVVAIPGSTNGLPVTSIGYSAFYFRHNLASVTIPNSVTNIGDMAFSSCQVLTNITLGTNVASIGTNAFGYCTNLAGIVIPNSVTSIGSKAFDTCTSLRSVTLSDSLTNLGTAAFQFCSSLAGVPLPDGITSIGAYTFFECGSLASVTIPNSVTSIGIGAFQNCVDLAAVAIPNGVASIGNDAFSYCRSLTNLAIANSVTSIGDGAFGGCAALASVSIPPNVHDLGNFVFDGCNSLKEVYFQGNAPDLGTNVFNSDTNATVYYLARDHGLGAGVAGLPTVLWNPQAVTNDTSFGVQTNQFGFTITGTSNDVVVVEASTNLAHPVWLPLQTNTLTGSPRYFSDPQWTNFPGRFYRFRSP